MRRILLAVSGTIAGLVALLSFKTHSALTNSAPLPSAGTTKAPAATPSPTRGKTSAPRSPARTRAPSPRAKATTPAPKTTTSSHTGQAISTQYGVVQVKVTVSGNKITNVSFVQLTAFDQHSQDINSQAAPILLQQTLSAQSANIDGVSGATYTSDGYEQSLQSALDKAGI